MDQLIPTAAATAGLPQDRGFTVFLVEDDEAARHSLSTSLETLGFQVKSFASCEEFLADRDKLGRGCLLLDYHFEGMSGLDLLHHLKIADASVPTILISGRSGSLLRKRAIDIPNVVTVLDKPLKGRDLLEAISIAQSLL